jgi:hypothetical protein
MFGSTGFTGFASWEMGVPCRLLLETRHAGRTLLGSPLPKASLGALKPLNRRYFKSMLELTQRRKSSVAALQAGQGRTYDLCAFQAAFSPPRRTVRAFAQQRSEGCAPLLSGRSHTMKSQADRPFPFG